MKPIAIIGGGITGLTAAFQLQKKRIPFTLYEAGPRLGGPIRTTRHGEYLAECGPNTILETSPEIPELVRDLGLESRRFYTDPAAANRYIARGGKPVSLPDSAARFIKTPLFSAAAKLRLGLEPFVRRAGAAEEESIAKFVTRRLGTEFLDYAINPLVGGVYAGDPAHLSVKHAFPKLHALEQRYGSLIAGQFLGARERKRRGAVSKQNAPKFSFDEGLEVLIQTLQRRMAESIRLEQPICELQRTENGWIVVLKGRGQHIPEEHSAVLIAIPAHDLARIKIAGTKMPDLSSLSEVYYPPVASVVLGFRREDVAHSLDGFGVLVPEAEGMKILGTIFSSSLFRSRAPAGHVTLTSYLGGARAPELALSDEKTLIADTLRDLRGLLGVSSRPTFEHCFVFRRAIPQYNVGYGRFKDLMAAAEAAAPGLLIGGHSRCGISLGDAIASGCEMVDKIQLFMASTAGRSVPEKQDSRAA
jgi:protoporphyrinogen/coproporphyrinogen III oxidase